MSKIKEAYDEEIRYQTPFVDDSDSEETPDIFDRFLENLDKEYERFLNNKKYIQIAS